MKAVAQSGYGPADVLSLRDLRKPSMSPGEVLVEVRAVGVDPGVWINMTGQPYAARAAFGLTRPKVAVRGRALAGIIAEVGAEVSSLKPGDEVYGTTGGGSFAEFAGGGGRLRRPGARRHHRHRRQPTLFRCSAGPPCPAAH